MSLFFAAAICVPAMAGVREDAAGAHSRGEYAEAFKLWLSLAEDGDGEAQMTLGFMCHDGEGTAKDYVLAYMWFYLAASNVSAGSQDFHDAFAARDLTARRMTASQVERAKTKAEECQEQKYKNCM